VISRTEEMKTRAVSIAEARVPQVSIAVDIHFPRAHQIECLRTLKADFPTVAINLRMTTMQGGERLVLEGTWALAVEKQHLCDAQMVTVCAPSHPLAATARPIAGERQWRVNHLDARHDLLTEACAGATRRVIWLRKTSRMEHSSNSSGARD
jgi:DNA-binding transcriptional LysR family regulator